ncbi:MAG: cytidine deaminase [Actinobacteria bacterium]|nr:cytidine deaminase [Actinomycetota bacterium]MBV8396549.1 cytidine deaminase [Actinomycetota bacterium]MBV8599093.1 cytidine deaminase [Actinomycetota bacterium]
MSLTEEQQAALDAAEGILARSYSPYSHFAVGACLVVADGTHVLGANVENAAYGSSICAERAALVRANAEGHRAFHGVAVIARGPVDEEAAAKVTGPCGACRQILLEFADIGGNDPWVVLASPDKRTIEVTSVRALVPYPFGPANL